MERAASAHLVAEVLGHTIVPELVKGESSLVRRSLGPELTDGLTMRALDTAVHRAASGDRRRRSLQPLQGHRQLLPIDKVPCCSAQRKRSPVLSSGSGPRGIFSYVRITNWIEPLECRHDDLISKHHIWMDWNIQSAAEEVPA